MLVVTHQGRVDRVSLCERHDDSDTIREYIGADYCGVYEGAHDGECEACEDEGRDRI